MMDLSIAKLILDYGVLAAILLMIVNGVVSAPPSELILTLVGILFVDSFIEVLFYSGIVSVGNLLGAYILYLVGKLWGMRFISWLKKACSSSSSRMLNWFGSKLPGNRSLLEYRNIFRDGGCKWVLIFRCLPVVRSIISLPAGAAMQPVSKFLVYSYVGMVIWAIFWISIGYVLKESWIRYQLEIFIPFSVALIIVLLIIYKRLRELSMQLHISKK